MLLKIFKTIAASFFIRKLIKSVDFFFFRKREQIHFKTLRKFTKCISCSQPTFNLHIKRSGTCQHCKKPLSIVYPTENTNLNKGNKVKYDNSRKYST